MSPNEEQNAGEVTPGDIVQITNPEHHWFPALIIVSELKLFGVMGYLTVVTNDKNGNGSAYIRLGRSEYEKVGRAAIVAS